MYSYVLLFQTMHEGRRSRGRSDERFSGALQGTKDLPTREPMRETRTSSSQIRSKLFL